MRLLASFIVAAALGASAVSASAMPFDPNVGQGVSVLSQVRDFCGRGRWRGPDGNCHGQRDPYGRNAYGRPRLCPPHMHAAYGHCRHNYY